MEPRGAGGPDVPAPRRRGGVLRDHLDTFRHDLTGRLVIRELLLQIGLPVALAAGALVAGLQLSDAAAVATGAAVLSGFLFGIALAAFQLRQGLAGPDRQAPALLPRLIDELFANVLWAVAAAFVTTALALAIDATQGVTVHHDPSPIPTLPSALLVLLAAHLLAVVGTCIRRLRVAYAELKR